jgi:hypothetical protein
VTGGGLSWSRAARSTTGYGTAEIWQAYAVGKVSGIKIVAGLQKTGYDGSITVTAFSGAADHVAASRANSGPTAAAAVRLTPSTTHALVWATGHNWNSLSTVTVPATQTVVHQYVDRRVNDVYWTQSVNEPTVAGTPVNVNVLTPNTGPWQLTAVEVPPLASAP